MKKITAITLLSIAAFSIVNNRSFSPAPAGEASGATAFNRPESAARLPPDLIVPPVLPHTIHDPLLLETWVRVYAQQEPIQLWEGVTVSGRGLAQYLLDHAIPVEWDTDHVCGNGSCSRLSCAAEHCTYADGKSGVTPIYVTPIERGDMPGLMNTLAHEIFHRTQPFGPVRSTRYEEFWAFVVGARISKSDWPSFGAYDPLDPNQLNLWFRENRLEYYFQYQEYPATIASRMYRGAYGGDPYSGIPTQAYGTS